MVKNRKRLADTCSEVVGAQLGELCRLQEDLPPTLVKWEAGEFE